MMVGVPVLLIVCVSAFVPFVWVMGVVVGVSGCCVFQWWVAVVSASRRVPGVVVGFGVWVVCLGVAGLVVGACGACGCVVGVGVGVFWLVCVLWWFRMLMCLASFFWFCVLFCFVVWLITGCLVVWARVGVCLWGVWVGVGVFCACFGVGWWLVAFSFVCGRGGVFCGRAKVCLSASCGLLGCCLCVGLAWCACGATTGCCLACEGV